MGRFILIVLAVTVALTVIFGVSIEDIRAKYQLNNNVIDRIFN